jgi:serine/threonine-protein kinase
MATVYLAQDLRHDRPVAIKVLAPELAAVAGRERFLQEVQILARLSHPNILPLHDSGISVGRPCYVMPFIEGESLRQRMDREGALPLEDVLRIAQEICGALTYAHTSGVVHRDIKPENILLAAGHAVVSDFGIARAVDNAVGNRLTQTGITLGTPAYMSPEQATGEVVDARSDLYSLGCLLYEMLTGQVPFPAATPSRVLARRLTENAPAARDLRPTVPPLLDEAVRRCLARNPADRFSSAEELHRALSPTDSGAHLWGAARLPVRRRNLAFAGVAGAVVVAAAASIALLGRADSPALSADRLVVFPFTVTGDAALDYLGEGMVGLLARNLDGAEGLRTVDPGTVLTAVASHRGGAVNDQGYRTVAGRVGGGAYVSGSVSAVGGQVRMQARWHSIEAGVESPVVSAEGAASDVLGVVDQLAENLLVSRGRGRRLVETAAVTTESLDALKAFVTAEHTLRGGPQFVDSAIAQFQRAVQIDSTFALAYYRLAVAADWNGRRTTAAPASRKAIAHAGRLSARDRRLLEAYAAYRSGAAEEAEAAYREVLRDYPDDIEAQFQLADVMVTYNPLRGRALDEPGQIFERVLAYDPGFL